ncbi:hypothetical protein AVEN_91112-1 [Araneus ventricosus]|uniref:Uncharacterized protein n=1 Tax=Araneus ventricosus TaxID=182803 RepID=A0A4Y2DIU7_ARAVE|nr:hypothetical protein AVEN_91112-1 [Araneus ventricosus]
MELPPYDNQKNWIYPSPAEASGHLNDSHCNSSSIEAGVLIAYHQAAVRPIPKEVRTITGGGTHSSTITIPPGEASARLLILRPLIRVLASHPGGDSHMKKVISYVI